LAVIKQVRAADSATRAGNFAFKYNAHLTELTGKTLGMVGFGHIAKRTVSMLKQAFQMEVLVYSPSAAEAELADYGAKKATLADVLGASDVLSLHVPLTPNTHHLIGSAELAQMKTSAVLINTSRGDVVDEKALVTALTTRQLAGAGLDVYHSETMPEHHPLLQLDNVVLTPHVGGSSQEALERTAISVCEQVIDVLNHKKPPHLVNPHIWQARRFKAT
jgi:D-3-phosphoglycerate dehydrogenase